MKYSPQGGNIIVSIGSTPDAVTVTVADSGISSEIIRRHGGKIAIESRGEGAIFRLPIPYRKVKT